MSMRVERSTLEEVQERFSEHRRRKEEQQRAEPSFQARVACAEEEEERQRAARRERKLQKRVRRLPVALRPAVRSRALLRPAEAAGAAADRGRAGGGFRSGDGGADGVQRLWRTKTWTLKLAATGQT